MNGMKAQTQAGEIASTQKAREELVKRLQEAEAEVQTMHQQVRAGRQNEIELSNTLTAKHQAAKAAEIEAARLDKELAGLKQTLTAQIQRQETQIAEARAGESRSRAELDQTRQALGKSNAEYQTIDRARRETVAH